MLWVLGFALSICGLCVWLEFGCMLPRSGGEKVYLEAVYKRPRYLATIVFSTQAIVLGFTGMPRSLYCFDVRFVIKMCYLTLNLLLPSYE